ncbi:hypothetical protein C8Q79DRAFT_791555 [Trametes meyenii]|nr:hypothetical protein C8Q79DRAFT_791555 [Trametes meyenii]
MIHMPLPSHFQSTTANRSLPRRVDSLKTNKGPNFSELEDELRDVRRVHAQGQEEDLRYALMKTITRVEELSTMLKDAYKAQADLQTEITLAKSNLQLALANNEMLEDALKRDPGSSRDVGWRRMSAREQSLKAEAEADRRRSIDSIASAELSSSSPTLPHPSPGPAPEHSPMPMRSATVPSPAQGSESRFFRFRFGNGSTSSGSHPSSPRTSGTQSPSLNGSHLTSASLPSLVPTKDYEKELEELHQQLEKERKAHKEADDAKAALESELESLSQALFEEANKMVATERRKLAETQDALREAQEQGEALKNVLRLFESGVSRSSTSSEAGVPPPPGPSGHLRSRHRASSSAVGVKSLPPSGAASPRSRPSSPSLPSSEPPSSAATLVARSPSPPPVENGGDTTILGSSSSADSALEVSETLGTTLRVSPSPSPSPSPSRSPTPSPDPSPLSPSGQYLFGKARPVDYFDGEESPWADATSAASPRITS